MPVVPEPSLSVDELGRLLQAADPAALLVAPRLLRRIIKWDRKLKRLGLQVPHRKSYVIERAALLTETSIHDLGIPPERVLPDFLLLLKRPDGEALARRPRGYTLVKYWQLLFHARVHKELSARFKEGAITESDLRRRLQSIGWTEVAEIRAVLRQELLLLPPEDERTVYEEFVAFFLQLRFFAEPLLPEYFSAIEDFNHIQQILAEDIDGAALFASTRLRGAPDPVWIIRNEQETGEKRFQNRTENRRTDDSGSRETPESSSLESVKSHAFSHGPSSEKRYHALVGKAERVSAKGNVVRAALARAQAARVAPASLANAAERGSVSELARLVERMRGPLHMSSQDMVAWQNALPALLEHAPDGIWPAEARLLYDLQKICIDHERPIYVPDVMEWMYSGLAQPLLQALPDQPLVLAVKHLRIALKRLPSVRLTHRERQALSHLLHGALHNAENRVRERFRPALREVLQRVGLRPESFPERMAERKLVEELLDRINERGFLNMSELRDALARNQLKLPDLSGPREFFRGDPLIRANRRLAHSAVGVYRRGEFYLRWLQRGSALAFGTQAGRWCMLILVLPFLGAFATIVFIQEMLHLLRLLQIAHIPHHLTEMEMAAWTGGLGVFYLVLMHAAPVRRLLGAAFQTGWQLVRLVLWDWPARFLRLPIVRHVLESRIYAISVQLVLKPLPIGLLVWGYLWQHGVDAEQAGLTAAGAFLCVGLFLTTRFGQDLEETALDWGVRNWDYVRGLLPGLIRLVRNFFKIILEAIDRFLYTVDEWLRFRGGEGRFILVSKVGLGFIWFLVTYVVRLYVNVFIEPTINPIKHFPVVTVAAKLLVPFWPVLLGTPHHPGMLGAPFEFFGPGMQFLMANVILHSLPGAAGFLVWEFKENWRLYRSNRPRFLRPEVIGHHGETMLRLLRPGFHSGTLPRLYAKLRRSERRAYRDRNWRTPRRLRETLHHVEESIRRFIEREWVAYVQSSENWHAGAIHVREIRAGANRIRIVLACPGLQANESIYETFELFFEVRAAWLLARVTRLGWINQLSASQAAVLTTALLGLYHKAGVQLVHEQIEAAFAPCYASYDLRDDGFVIWPDPESEVLYDLTERPTLHPRSAQGKPSCEPPTLDRRQLLFTEQPLSWEQWVKAWEHEEKGGGAPPEVVPHALFARLWPEFMARKNEHGRG